MKEFSGEIRLETAYSVEVFHKALSEEEQRYPAPWSHPCVALFSLSLPAFILERRRQAQVLAS